MDTTFVKPVGRFVLTILFFLCCLLLLEFCHARPILSHPKPGERIAVYTIADPAGDWGGYFHQVACFMRGES